MPTITFRTPSTDPIVLITERIHEREIRLRAIDQYDSTNGKRRMEVESELFYLKDLLVHTKKALGK